MMNVPLTSSLCCCSLKLKDSGLMARFYSTQGCQDGSKTRDSLGSQSLRSIYTSERETLRHRLNAFARQGRKSSSIQRFEPCYRQIYPSKKRKASFKIPKKPPYIPAVCQKQTRSYRDKYDKVDLEPAKGRRLQWPPLYPSKRKDYPQPRKSEDKTQALPSWLLPLYSCKNCRNENVPSTSEARFSGSAFSRKMELMESIKQIRANQDVLLGRLQEKDTKKDGSTHLSTNTSANAVEALKRKINSMHDYLSAMKNMKAYRNEYQTQKTARENELAKEPVPVRLPYARIYRTKPPTLDQEFRVRKSIGVGVSRPKPLEPVPGTSGGAKMENAKEVDDKRIYSPKKQYEESVPRNPETNSTKQMVFETYPDGKTINNLPLGQIHKESVVMIKQPSWKKHLISNSQTNNESISGEKKTQILNSQTNIEFTTNQIRTSPKRHQGETINDTCMTNQQSKKIKIHDIQDGAKPADPWTVKSLKSRINVMKIKNTLNEPDQPKIEEMTMTRNGGELNPKISQVALRSFHKAAGNRNPRKIHVANPTKPRLGNRRDFSTFRPLTSEQTATRALGYCRRTIFNAPQNKNKKRSWVSRLKRCFVLNKIKGSKCENWKEAPREIPYASEEVKHNSPAPILWKPSGLDRNLETRSKPAETAFREKVNPAVLNAEHRVLASISRLISTESTVPDVQVLGIEDKIKRAEHKVNMIPWFKRSKELRGSYNNLEKNEHRESGYEWLLKNRDMVEELKRQSRNAAGKSLVPTEVKNAINQYKLPLKGEISRYRSKMDHKFSEQLYIYSTSKRWYSTCFAGKQRSILSCSDVLLVNARGIHTTEFQKENFISSKFLDRRTRSDIVLGPKSRRYNQGASHRRRKIEEINANPVEAKRTRWSWKIPNKTRNFTQKPITLTSPSKTMGTRMSEMSPCALKKQVEELKHLIKKAREDVPEKTDEFPIDLQSGDKYEARLKRLVRAAHNNAQKMQIVGPKYTSENNMLINKPSGGKQSGSKRIIQHDTKSENSKNQPEVSVLKSLFRNTKGNSKTLADEILSRNNLTALPALAPKESDKPISRVYLKLKSLVEAVRNKSAMLDSINDVKLLPSKSLKGSMSMDAMLPLSKSIVEESGKLGDATKMENAEKSTSLVTVGLSAQKTPSPSNTIQLWKGEAKPKEFNFENDKEPTYGDLLTLFTKAKGLFYYQPPEDVKVIDGESLTTETHTNSDTRGNKDIATNNEMTKNWLSIREDISNAARAVSKQKNDPQRETFQASLHLSSGQQNESGVDKVSEYMMTKSKMIPFELLKSESKITCDHMWASVPVKVLEDEDFCRKPGLEADPTHENQSSGQPDAESTSLPKSGGIASKPVDDNLTIATKLGQPGIDQQQPVCLEPTKRLSQKRMITLGSLTKNFGVGSLLGKVAESSNNADTEAAGSLKTTHMNDEGNTGVLNPLGEIPHSNYPEMKLSHDINVQSLNTSGGNITSNSSQVADNIQQEVYLQNTTISNSSDKQPNQPGINDQYGQDCIESLRPLEDKVEEYENYYKSYFTEDVVSRYENLHKVYDGLIKLNRVGRYQSLKNPLNTGTGTWNESSSRLICNNDAFTSRQTSDEGTQSPMEMESGIIRDLNTHGSVDIPSNDLAEVTKTKQDGTINQQGITAMTTSGTPVSSLYGGVSEVGFNDNGHTVGGKREAQLPANDIIHSEPQLGGRELALNAENNADRQFKPIDATCHTESFKATSGNIREGIQFHESDPVPRGPTNSESYSMQESKNIQSQSSGLTKKEEPASFEDLLTQDPTLNPEVVKNLKLPAILTEDCHTEKNWYTKFFSGPHQNH